MPNMDPGMSWTIVGNIISFISLIVAVVLYLLGKKKTLLQYYQFTSPLITEEMAGRLNGRISIDGQPVKNLSSTTISFINSGNEKIQFSDFSVQEPLRIILEGHFYDCSDDPGNQKLRPKVEHISEKILNVSFENLKPGQFFRIKILHDGTLDVSGELKTGTMRKYRYSRIFLMPMIIIDFACIVFFVDYAFSGPFFALIGIFEALLCMIAPFVLLLLFAVYIYKDGKERKLFMS